MNKTLNINYKLHASQFQVFSDPARFVILSAGRRFGKTVLALIDLLSVAFAKEKSRCWYVAPTYKQAEMIAWKMLQDMVPKEAILKKNEVKLEIILVNGSEISLKGADNEDSLRGVGLHFVVLDEYAGMKPNVWQEIVRPMLTDTLGRALFIGTPKGKNHFWELWLKGQRRESGYSSYQMQTAMNPYIQRSELKEAETQLNERYFRQEYLASFEDYVGLIWPEFDEKIHVIAPFIIPDWWETVAAIDTAISGTTAVLKAALDEDGNIFITNEYYEQNKRVSEVSDSVRGWRPGLWLVDPAAKIRTQKSMTGSIYSLFDEFLDNGIVLIPAENDVNAGINRVAEYYKANKIKVFNTCKNLIYETQRYHWSEERETVLGVSMPKPYKHLDHAVDCKRYILMSRPSISRQPVKKSTGMTDYNMDRMEEQQHEQEEEYA